MTSIRSEKCATTKGDDARSSSTSAYVQFDPIIANLDFSAEHKSIDINDGETMVICDHQIQDKVASTDQGASLRTCQSNCCKCIDITATTTIIALTWMLIAIPTILYINTSVSGSTSESVAQDGKSEVKTNHITTCTLHTGSYSDPCTTYLQEYTYCLRDYILTNTNASVDVYIVQQPGSMISEINVILRVFSRPQCLMILEPLVCLYYFHLCYEGMDTGPSEKQCNHILNTCDKELELVKIYGYDIHSFLSECSPTESPLDSKGCSIIDGQIFGNDSVNISYQLQPFNCHGGFFYQVKTKGCTPECSVWAPHSNAKVLIADIVAIFSLLIGAISGVAVLLVSWIQHQKPCRYPSIFVIYQTIPVIMLAILLLIGFCAIRYLFCSSKDLFEAFLRPTPFCWITGVVLFYATIQLLFWWLWHTVAVFWAVKWPLHSKKFNTSSKLKYFHTTVILAGLIFPILPVLIVGLKGGFTITISPGPILCTGANVDSTYWAIICPTSIMLGIGTSILIYTLCIVIKKHLLSKIYKLTSLKLESRVRVILILWFYVIVGVAILAIFTHDLTNASKNVIIVKYFLCESKGTLPNSNESRCTHLEQSVQEVFNPISSAVAIIIFIGLVPSVNLVYVFKFTELKSMLRKCFQKHTRNTVNSYYPNISHDPECKSVALHRNLLT